MNPDRLLRAFALGVLACVPAMLASQQATPKPGFAAAAHARPHELMGFLLRQDRKAFEAALGKPFHEEEGPNSTHVCAYHLPGSKENYLAVFFFVGESKNSELNGKAVQMELTGSERSEPTGFFGLALGDSPAKVEAVLGTPTKTSHESEENLDLWDYEESNYTLEFDSDHKLYSIQIIDQETEEKPGTAGSDEVRLFAQAIREKAWDRVLEMASGEIECSTPKDFGVQAGPARSLLTDPKSGVSLCLERAADAILALGPDMKGADDALRIWEKHSAGAVTKLPPTSPLSEVVFDREAGAWRVYEVTFR